MILLRIVGLEISAEVCGFEAEGVSGDCVSTQFTGNKVTIFSKILWQLVINLRRRMKIRAKTVVSIVTYQNIVVQFQLRCG